MEAIATEEPRLRTPEEIQTVIDNMEAFKLKTIGGGLKAQAIIDTLEWVLTGE